MKICAVCNETFNDEFNFCELCGNQLSVAQAEPIAQTEGAAPRRRMDWSIFGIALVAAAILITVASIVFSPKARIAPPSTGTAPSLAVVTPAPLSEDANKAAAPTADANTTVVVEEEKAKEESEEARKKEKEEKEKTEKEKAKAESEKPESNTTSGSPKTTPSDSEANPKAAKAAVQPATTKPAPKTEPVATATGETKEKKEEERPRTVSPPPEEPKKQVADNKDPKKDGDAKKKEEKKKKGGFFGVFKKNLWQRQLTASSSPGVND